MRGFTSLTGLSDTKDFTEDECELDAAPGKRAFVLVFSAAVFQDELGKQLNKEGPGDTERLLGLLKHPQRRGAHPAVGVRIASGKVIHGVQSEKPRRGSYQILPRVAVVLKRNGRRDAKQIETRQTPQQQQTLTEKPNFLNSLAQRERRLSLLRLPSLSHSKASWRKP